MSTEPNSLRATRWQESGLLDIEFYGALRGRDFRDATAAVEDFIDEGMRRRLSPHPSLDFVSLPPEIRRAWRQGAVGQVLNHLTSEDGRVLPAGPLVDTVKPTSARDVMLALARLLGHEATGVVSGQSAVIDFSALEGRALVPDRWSVVVVAAAPRPTVRAVERVLRHADGLEVEVLVVDGGSPSHVSLHLQAAVHELPGAQLIRLPERIPAGAAINHGVARATGETLVLLDPHVVVRRGWMSAALESLRADDVAGVQPVVLGSGDTIHSAGLVVAAVESPPVPVLVGHPKEDARRLEGHRLAGISGDAMILRTRDVVALGGLKPTESRLEATLDLCARLLSRRPSGFRLATTAMVTTTRPDPIARERRPQVQFPADPGIYERIGFQSDARAPYLVVKNHREAADQLRWSLKLPSSAGPGGDLWGDTHFADALAEALRDLGQDVVSSRRGAHAAGPIHLDDVSLALRGLYPIPPMPGQLNVLWVISHPDDVNPLEFEGYDVVCAASVPWSAELSARTGREVIPLLQATAFQPPDFALTPGRDQPDVVFVGSASADRERPLVWKAVEAGVPLAVYGRGWEGLPEGVWRDEYIDNRRLAELYHRHGIVLADHWPDMARNGFIANRVFDAVASGARVICDDVVGVHDVFDPRDVVVARSPEDIAAAVADWERPAPGEHVQRPPLSFHDRARTLLERVLPLSQSSAVDSRRG